MTTPTPPTVVKRREQFKSYTAALTELLPPELVNIVTSYCYLCWIDFEDEYEIVHSFGYSAPATMRLVKNKKNKRIFTAKFMNKKNIVDLENVVSELQLLTRFDHPAVVKLMAAWSDGTALVELFDFVCQEDLFQCLPHTHDHILSEVQFVPILAELVDAIAYFHEQGFVYGSLQPEKLLLDEAGHVSICHLEFCESFLNEDGKEKTLFGIKGPAEYRSPEMLSSKPYSKEIDWWALGVMTYEILIGCPPFYHPDTSTMHMNIKQKALHFPPWRVISAHARDFITLLLSREPTERPAVERITAHPLFEFVDWNKVRDRTQEMAFIPQTRPSPDGASEKVHPPHVCEQSLLAAFDFSIGDTRDMPY